MPTGSGLRIVRMGESHLPTVFSLIDNEHWGWEYAEIREIHRIDPGSSVVALDGREVVGLTTCVDFGSYAFIIHVIVRKGWRGKGVGARMMDRMTAELDSRGVETVELHANPAALDFYRPYSFKRLQDVSYFTRAPQPLPAHREHDAGSYSWLSEDDLPRISESFSSWLGYDLEDLRDALRRSPPHHSLSRREGGRLSALMVSRVGEDINALGPWVMEEPTRAGAESMMRAFLSGTPAKKVDLLAPESSEAALAAFEASGFTLEMRGISRLVRSTRRVSAFPESVLAVGHLGLI